MHTRSHRDTSVGSEIKLDWTRNMWFDSRPGRDFPSSPKHSNEPWAPPSLLLNLYPGSFPRGTAARVKLTTRRHLLTRLKGGGGGTSIRPSAFVEYIGATSRRMCFGAFPRTNDVKSFRFLETDKRLRIAVTCSAIFANSMPLSTGHKCQNSARLGHKSTQTSFRCHGWSGSQNG
jgi:hypothetical protein